MTIQPFETTQPVLGAGVFVHDTALVVGDVRIGDHSSVWPFTIARGDVNAISIGTHTNIQDNSVLHVTHDGPYNPGGYALHIGNHVTVGHRVILHGCRIGNNCLIGMGATVMDGAVLEDNILLGAGSLVTPNKTLESGYLWVGAPVKRIRALTDQEIEALAYSAQHYVRLKDRYLAEQH
ncbi:MAG: gamma carbonic anhydrase family protein [Gammaproteobacteria bacterium]|nr:gamma carbonic anhydrase family protein [Gammaproteobacteria bacterium]MDH5650271.1 gamma carbonic anhydrase family protein [Gammaproteobacteria bacterium]